MNPILEKIKQRGHWVFRFRGGSYNGERLASPIECDELARKLIVKLRGWSFPHYPRGGATYGPNYCEGTVDWEGHLELWRVYQSGQFIEYMGLREDWIAEDTWFAGNPRFARIRPGQALFILSTIYTLTEVFEFLRRLTSHGLFGDAVNVSIELNGIEGRRLELLDDFSRAPLLGEYVARVPRFQWEGTYPREEVLEKSSEVALTVVQRLFILFQWGRQPVDTFRSDQVSLLEGRL